MKPEDAVAVAAISAAASALTALLSVTALIVSVWLQWRASRPRVEVVGNFNTLISATAVGETRFGIEVRNVGVLPIVVSSVGVIFKDGERGTLPHARTALNEYVLPKPLGPGDAVSLTNELKPILESNKERGIRGVWAMTASGRLVKGKNKAKLSAYKGDAEG